MIKNEKEVVTQVAQKGKFFVRKSDTLESASTGEEVGNGARPIIQNI